MRFWWPLRRWPNPAYFGMGLGQMTVQDVEPFDFGAGVDASVDDTDTSFKFFAGFQFSPNVAAEFSYEDLGEASIHYTDGFDSLTEKAEVTAMTLSIIGLLPLQEDFSVFGRFGLAKADVDFSIKSTFGVNGSDSSDSTEPLFGLGLQYDIENVLLRAEFTRFKDVGEDSDTEGNDVDVFGIGAGVMF